MLKYFKIYLVYTTIIFVFLLYNFADAGKYELQLLKDLFQNYNELERPVENESSSLDVIVGLSMLQIVALDEKTQVLKCSGWMDYGWYAYNLKWDPSQYGNVTIIRVPSTKIWTPDILLYTSAADSFDTTLKVNALVNHTGHIKYLPPVMLTSICEIDISDFPFDEQKCLLKFGSWTYDESKINLSILQETAQLDSYTQNGEWDLVGVKSYQQTIKYDCCAEKYPFVMFTVHLRRRTLYFIFNLVFPCVLISFMAVLGFALPSDSGEKMGLEITTLLSIVMFLQFVMNIIPESSKDVPKIGIYFASVMLICTISVIANVIILVFHHRNVKIHEMPPWIKIYICGHLARLLGMKRPIDKDDRKNSEVLTNLNNLHKYNVNKDLNEPSSRSLLANVYDDRINDFVLNDDFGVINNEKSFIKSSDTPLKTPPIGFNFSNNITKGRCLDNYKLSQKDLSILNKNKNSNASLSASTTTITNTSHNDFNMLKREIHVMLKEVRSITKKIQETEEEEDKSLDWKFAAMVLDKLCLYVFCIVTITSTCAILFSSRNFFRLK